MQIYRKGAIADAQRIIAFVQTTRSGATLNPAGSRDETFDPRVRGVPLQAVGLLYQLSGTRTQ